MKNVMKMTWQKALVLVLLLAVMTVSYVGFAPKRQVAAQGSNILVNPSFGETWYGASGVDGQVPTGWNIWASGQKPATDRYVDSAFTRTPPAWITRGGFVSWTGGGYQTVAVENGATYRFSIFAFTYVCNDLATSCIGNGVPRTSDQTIGSKVKVGIDPTGGTDATSANIVWSALSSPYDKFVEIAVEAQARAGSITVFTFNSVDNTPNLRETVWDDGSLIKTAATSTTPGVVATTAPPAPAGVPFVSAQSARPDGSVVHRVTDGDTFSSIVVAYRPLGVTRDMILQANGWDLPPQIIVPGQEIIILPAGSVNPQTGQVINLPGGGSVPPAPTAGSVPPVATEAPPAATPSGDPITVNPPAAPPAGGPSNIRPADAEAEKGG